MARPTLCVVTAIPMSLETFWPPLLQRVQELYDITVVTRGANQAMVDFMGVRARPLDVPIPRRPAPWSDWRAMGLLVDLFRRERFDIVHSQTPKAGLLAMTAARRTRVPVRIHTFTGQVWATRRGLRRRVLRAFDRYTARCATALLTDSHSQREFLIRERVVAADRLTVLANGSMCGVETTRFRPDADARRDMRREMGAGEDDVVILFMGRLVREKGIAELLEAFVRLASTRPGLRLWLVGPDEGAMAALAAVPESARAAIGLAGHTHVPERFMAAADVLALPSYREGFGSSVIEAAGCGIPSVASRIYGLTDAVVDEETGLLHQPRDVDDLARQLGRLVDDRALRARMGEAALRRVKADFRPDVLAAELCRFYERLR